MRLYLCSILLIIIIILTFYLNKNTESFENDIDLNGKWIINSDIPNKTKLINILQTGNDIKGNDDNYLLRGTGNIVYNKLIWLWNNDEDTKMIGDIILEDLSNKKIVTQIKWQNGNNWKKILPAINIQGKWIGDGLVHGPIQIKQENN